MEPDEPEQSQEDRLTERIRQIDPNTWQRPLGLGATVLTWLTVHGYVSLALRHPSATGPSRRLAESFLEATERLLVEAGVLDETDLAAIRGDHLAQAPADPKGPPS